MIRTVALTSALSLALATGALAVTGQFSNMCAEGLALHKEIKTDCAINGVYKGKTYCFGSESRREQQRHRNGAEHDSTDRGDLRHETSTQTRP